MVGAATVATLLVGMNGAVATPGPETGDDGRFAVADISPTRAPAAVLDKIERDVGARRPGLRIIDDSTIRGLLRTAEAPAASVARHLDQARARRAAGDCPAALAAAATAENEALQTMWLDEQRAPLRTAYAIMLLCEDAQQHQERAAAAARSLRQLTSIPPDEVPGELWDRFPGATTGTEQTELQVDTDPPNAHVTVNFHEVGFTPRTVKTARGPVLIQLEKRGHKREVRRIELGKEPVHLTFKLADRRLDRSLSVRDLVAGMRGREPERDRAALARLAQLTRADVLVLVSAAEGTVRVWTFDAERGEITATSGAEHAPGKS